MRISDAEAMRLLRQSASPSREQLEALRQQLKETRRPLQDLIVENGLLSEAELTKLYGDTLNLEFVEIPAGTIDRRSLERLPEHIAHRYSVVVFDASSKDGAVLVAMEDPSDDEALNFLYKQFGDNLKPYLTTSTLIRAALAQYRHQPPSGLISSWNHLEPLESGVSVGTLDLQKKSVARESLEKIIDQALRYGASDVHFEPRPDHLVIRYRIDGLLFEAYKLSLKAFAPLLSVVKSAAQLSGGDQLAPQYGQWNVKLGEQNYRLDVSIVPNIDGQKTVIHIVQEMRSVPNLKDLGLWNKALRDVQRAMLEPHGVILVSGLEESGKSTTLYSLLASLNSPHVNIASVVDKAEYRLPGVNQFLLQANSPTDIVAALNAVLSQDPNIIMLSELNAQSVAEQVFSSGRRGHLMLARLHASSAAGGLRRLKSLGLEPHIIGTDLRIIIFEQLARRLCTTCRELVAVGAASRKHLDKLIKQAGQPSSVQLHSLELQALEQGVGLVSEGPTAQASSQVVTSNREITHLWHAHSGGCSDCHYSGYQGRVGLFEVLSPSDILKPLMSDGSEKAIEQTALKAGVMNYQLDGLIKALRGVTTVEEVLRVSTAR